MGVRFFLPHLTEIGSGNLQVLMVEFAADELARLDIGLSLVGRVLIIP